MATSSVSNSPADPLLQPGSFIDAEGNESTPMAASETPPSWLPQGWTIFSKVRESGASAGSMDRYYFEPGTGHRFRSRREVEFYLQTGTKRKKTDAAAEVQPSQSPAGRKKKKSGSGPKNGRPTPPPPEKFDYENIPEMVTWRLQDGSDESTDHWVPFVDDKMVPKSVQQIWDAALQANMN